MTTTDAISYPVTPKNVDEKIVQPSAEFRQEVVKVLYSILFFIATYFFLVVAAIALAALCGYGGIMLISFWPGFVTIMLGLGMIGMGIMVLVFLFKFMFTTNTVDRSNLIEITAKEQPVLFDFIRKLSRETQTPLPKKIYLSADVNASVFYDSGFWSMFLPVRKNLQIGLGLVNTVNVSEFKAIIAHEFGHFSQRSMKLGSYVYNVNRVIYNLLYDNTGYGRTLEGWGNVSNYFALFANLTVGIVKGIQAILQHLYTGINQRYLALSRQMEFHADAVAASVSGSSPLITSLRRLDLANSAYDQVLDYYNLWYRENRKAENLYHHQAEVMAHMAQLHGLQYQHGVIQVTAQSFARYNKTRVMIKDQWASHPSTDDREAHLKALNVEADVVSASAWTLFTGAEKLQQKITDGLYETVKFERTPEPVDLATFRSLYYERVEKYSFDKRYKGFYDARNIEPFDVETLARETSNANDLSEVLTEETLNLPIMVDSLAADIQTLEHIQVKSAGVKMFEFNGEKYNQQDAGTLAQKLGQELEETKTTLNRADQEVFRYFHKTATQQGRQQELEDHYKKMFLVVMQNDEELEALTSLLQEVSQLYQPNLTEEAAIAVTNNLRRKEVPIKEKLKQLLADPEYSTYYTTDDKAKIEQYVEKQRLYLEGGRFNAEAFTLFNEAASILGDMLSQRSFHVKKEALAWDRKY